MRIKLLRNCVVPGHPGVFMGDVIECKPDVATALIALERAIETTEELPRMVEIPRVETVENRDPVFPVRRGRKLNQTLGT